MAFFLPVSANNLDDVTLHIGLQVDETLFDIALVEVAISGVRRPELAAIDGGYKGVWEVIETTLKDYVIL